MASNTDFLAALYQELDRLRSRIAELERERAETASSDAVARADAALATKQIIETVLRWGGHHADCAFDVEGCTCGWEAVVEALNEFEEEFG
jgi:hypothetical protein